MSDQDAFPGGSVGDYDGAQKVEDPGEYNQKVRLQEIAQARTTARRALSGEAQDAYGDRWHEVAMREVQNFAKEIEWLIKDGDNAEYLTAELGPITIPAPSKEEIAGQRVLDESIDSVEFSVKGLYTTRDTGTGFVDLPGSLSHTWTTKVTTRHHGPQTVETTRETPVPITVTKKADSLCRKFLHEVGLDARIEDQIDEDPNPV